MQIYKLICTIPNARLCPIIALRRFYLINNHSKIGHTPLSRAKIIKL